MGWGRGAILLMTPSCCPASGRIPRVEGGLMLGGKGAKGCGPSWISSSLPPSGKKSWKVSYDFFFGCKETRQTLRATWSCISSRLNAMITDFLKTLFSVGERFLYSLSHFFLQTVSILEQRLMMTENKLREYLDNQLTLLEHFSTEYRKWCWIASVLPYLVVCLVQKTCVTISTNEMKKLKPIPTWSFAFTTL